MPIKIPNGLPAAQTLASENIFVMNETRASTQDIRPLQILVLNLMPTKIETETQLSRLLGNTPLQVELEFIHTSSHESKNTSKEHLFKFYQVFDQVKDRNFDGMVITGAPVEQMPFEQVEYWPELCRIMEWSKTHVYSTFHICWGAQAGLYYHYGIRKYDLPEKLFGVFPHTVERRSSMLMRGFDDTFMVPHSRHTTIHRDEVEACGELTFSLTSGMVSALNREVTFSNGLRMSLIQTDAAINSGNSGGALFNMYGEVVGITNAKYGSSSSSSTASIDNIGFAIPINDVRSIVESIIENGYIVKPYVGVSVTNVSSESQQLGLPQGAAVAEVVADSPAETAGLKVNDIITAVNGDAISGSSALVDYVGNCAVGDELTLSVYRQGETLELKLTVGQKTQDALPQNTDSQSAQNEQSQQNEQYNYYYGQNGQSGFPFNFFN